MLINSSFISSKVNIWQALYKACHIFTLDAINDGLINLILQKEQNNFYKYIKTLKQIMINFIPIDKNTFIFYWF